MSMRSLGAGMLAAALGLAVVPAHAITSGDLDGTRHPYVGLMVAQTAKGEPLWRCSGTLLSPTIFLTAGHCTEAPAAKVEIWFDADIEHYIPQNGYPYKGDASGKPFTHPQFDSNRFYLYDLGVVVLKKPVSMPKYAALPAQDVLDRMVTQRGVQDVTFTAVGYGLQQINPVFVESERVRMLATPHLVQINTGYTGDFSLLLSNNNSTGGTCFGDSGGPNFIGKTNVIAAVTSFGINGNCAGTGGVYRVDRFDDLNWLYSAFGDQL